MECPINPQEWLQSVSDERRSFFRRTSDIFNAFEYGKIYSSHYNNLIKSKVSYASEAIFGFPVPEGVAVFSFGAPARKEMLGGSDADIAVYRAGRSGKESELRELLVKSLQNLNFTKVDTPVWGNLDEILQYMNTSVTEANQILEAQYICGDPEFREQVEALRASSYNKVGVARNLVFQFIYFEQYYRKKASPNHINLKYCLGGTRDFLFPVWYAQLKCGIERDLQTTATERGLDALCAEGLLTVEEVADVLKSASAISFIRDEIMRITPGDVDGRLSLDKAIEVCGQIPMIFSQPQEIIRVVNESRQKIIAAKNKVWCGLCKYFSETKSEEWNEHFRNALSDADSAASPLEFRNDDVIDTVRISNIDAQNLMQYSEYIEEAAQSDSWTVLAALLSNSYVPGCVIDSVIRRRGITPGYEYFLEIAARNPNLERETLEFMVSDDKIEHRFKKPALKLAKELGYG